MKAHFGSLGSDQKATIIERAITVFPDFGKEVCLAGPVILHEAAHSAGACDDINKGKSYPPASAENNAYSCEYFASDVVAGYRATTELKAPKLKAPEIKD